MATRGIHRKWGAFLLCGAIALAAFPACTNNKLPRRIIQDTSSNVPPPPAPPRPVIAETAYIQLDGGVTEFHRLALYNGALIGTGKPHALIGLGVNGDPEEPDLFFVAKDYIIDANPTDNWTAFSHPYRFGPYIPDLYGRNALTIHNGKAIMSGTHGMSVVPLGNLNRPIERWRLPAWINNQPRSDARYQYTALLSLPNTNTVVGFRRNDGFFYLNAATNQVVVTSNTPVPYPSSFCCVSSATIPWNSNAAYVSIGRGLLEFRVNGSTISFVREINTVRATHVYGTRRYLYIQNTPHASDTNSLPAGILAVTPDGKLKAVLPFQANTFVVSDDDRFIYADIDGKGLSVIRILTENIPGWLN